MRYATVHLGSATYPKWEAACQDGRSVTIRCRLRRAKCCCGRLLHSSVRESAIGRLSGCDQRRMCYAMRVTAIEMLRDPELARGVRNALRGEERYRIAITYARRFSDIGSRPIGTRGVPLGAASWRSRPEDLTPNPPTPPNRSSIFYAMRTRLVCFAQRHPWQRRASDTPIITEIAGLGSVGRTEVEGLGGCRMRKIRVDTSPPHTDSGIVTRRIYRCLIPYRGTSGVSQSWHRSDRRGIDLEPRR